jgi:DNA replicative helicase MCM subunit Mcm2 (Cdc46/Mcm family)
MLFEDCNNINRIVQFRGFVVDTPHQFVERMNDDVFVDREVIRISNEDRGDSRKVYDIIAEGTKAINVAMRGEWILVTGVLSVQSTVCKVGNELSYEHEGKTYRNVFQFLAFDILVIEDSESNELPLYLRPTENIDSYVDKVAESICPRITGLTFLKKAILYTMIGGTISNSVRSNNHLLIVVYPKMHQDVIGIIRFLQMELHCLGAHQSGISTTALRGSIIYEPSRGGWIPMNGLLQMANRKILFLYNLHMFADDEKATLLEAMETGKQTRVFADIMVEDETEVTIIAVCLLSNCPVDKQLGKHLKLSSPLMSRFSGVVFVRNSCDPRLIRQHALALAGLRSVEHFSPVELSKIIFNCSRSQDDIRSEVWEHFKFWYLERCLDAKRGPRTFADALRMFQAIFTLRGRKSEDLQNALDETINLVETIELF